VFEFVRGEYEKKLWETLIEPQLQQDISAFGQLVSYESFPTPTGYLCFWSTSFVWKFRFWSMHRECQWILTSVKNSTKTPNLSPHSKFVPVPKLKSKHLLQLMNLCICAITFPVVRLSKSCKENWTVTKVTLETRILIAFLQGRYYRNASNVKYTQRILIGLYLLGKPHFITRKIEMLVSTTNLSL